MIWRRGLAFPALLLLAVAFPASGAPPEDELRRKALEGDGSAQLLLAGEFFFGRNRPGNLALAAYWYRRAAGAGVPEGDYNLGACYEHGWGVEKSLQLAFRHYSRAAEKGFAPAVARRARLLYSGIPAGEANGERFPAISSDPVLALRELRRAAESGFAPAQLELARRLYSDPESRRERAAEIGELARRAAAAPGAGEEALLFYADCLRLGVGMTADGARAAEVMEEAVGRGSCAAMSRLGRMLEFGLGVPPDPERAMKLYRAAADGGDPAGMAMLADHLLAGDGAETDPVRAVELYRASSAAGYSPAFAKLGDCLAYGWGTPPDAAAAFRAYEQGAAAGDAAAQYRLGRCYAGGRGTARDPAAAVFWFKCAGAAGNRDAVRELGAALLRGFGVEADPVEGRRLLEAAARAGDREAAAMLAK